MIVPRADRAGAAHLPGSWKTVWQGNHRTLEAEDRGVFALFTVKHLVIVPDAGYRVRQKVVRWRRRPNEFGSTRPAIHGEAAR